jgi:hypothetical protein
MRKSGIVLVVGLSLMAAGCQPTREQLAVETKRDEEACRSYGAKPGTDAMVNCRVTLAKTHEDDRSRRRAALLADNSDIALIAAMTQPRYSAPTPVMRQPVICNHIGTQTICN